jgi:hypothetical protein
MGICCSLPGPQFDSYQAKLNEKPPVAGFERNYWAGNREVLQEGQRAEREASGLPKN